VIGKGLGFWERKGKAGMQKRPLVLWSTFCMAEGRMDMEEIF
jgi:hypothetical protein